MLNFLEPYQAEWLTEFEQLKKALLQVLEEYEIDVQHVGSTAIPNLFAKPILDIDVILENKSLIGEITSKLELIGYKSRGEQGIPGRFAFRQESKKTPNIGKSKIWQEHHLYVCYSDSLALKNHLLFRDALLKNQKLVQEYSQLKLKLTKEPGMTREDYTRKKTDFILSVLSSFGLDETELNEIKRANL
ncbi:GrpB family protein [Algoriphagus lacus]|uniref:GrpB family protein n=1 Tax=Algoriphagus lacus TaxID=2056311 RepID=A0A418PSD4_9BACT|nr:GrpB family protein [Algoriphagus lacus]RIW15770.1 GrpB family protein [Algoriphagus lacus]